MINGQDRADNDNECYTDNAKHEHNKMQKSILCFEWEAQRKFFLRLTIANCRQFLMEHFAYGFGKSFNCGKILLITHIQPVRTRKMNEQDSQTESVKRSKRIGIRNEKTIYDEPFGLVSMYDLSHFSAVHMYAEGNGLVWVQAQHIKWLH